jgi:hypothetical protein
MSYAKNILKITQTILCCITIELITSHVIILQESIHNIVVGVPTEVGILTKTGVSTKAGVSAKTGVTDASIVAVTAKTMSRGVCHLAYSDRGVGCGK